MQDKNHLGYSHVKQQIELVRKEYDEMEILDEILGIIAIPLHEKVTVIVDMRKYPKKPILEIPSELKKITGKPEKFLETLANWKKKDPPNVVDVINEFKNFLAIQGSGEILLSLELMKGICKWASALHPKECLGLLRKENGVISEMILPPGMQSNETSAIFSGGYRLAIDKSIVGSVHSHPRGNPTPSTADLAHFSQYHINIIIGYPYVLEKIRCYDREGHPIPFKLLDG